MHRVLVDDPTYPPSLAALRFPPALSATGELSVAHRRGVLVAGTRRASALGYGATLAAVEGARCAQVPVVVTGADHDRSVASIAVAAAVDARVPVVLVAAGPWGSEFMQSPLATSVLGGGGVVVAPQPAAALAVAVALAGVLVVAEGALGRDGVGVLVALAVAGQRFVLTAVPAATHRRQPGAAAAMALSDPAGVNARQAGVTGALAAAVASRAPVADAVAYSREELAVLTEVAARFVVA